MKTNNETATAFVKGYESKSGNLCTNGETLTSYDTDIATHANGVILMAKYYRCKNWDSWGYFLGQTKTTERHKSEVKTACYRQNVKYFEVATIAIFGRKEHERNYQLLKAEAVTLSERANRARKEANRRFYTEQANRAEATAQSYWNIFLAD